MVLGMFWVVMVWHVAGSEVEMLAPHSPNSEYHTAQGGAKPPWDPRHEGGAWADHRLAHENRGMAEHLRGQSLPELKGEARARERAKERSAKASPAPPPIEEETSDTPVSVKKNPGHSRASRDRREQQLATVYPRTNPTWDSTKMAGPVKWCSLPCDSVGDDCQSETVPCERLKGDLISLLARRLP
eukprot:TRINITY_DN21052_c0_g1_i4.p2 TRINITY_DN21052_c0_g1~~TRINITY_DN21052_c0_g1_i4.p2  ORF type:complete len:186 (+),score=28.37 TRINITY_DN21052_c0_g1_i4:244-801(+)